MNIKGMQRMNSVSLTCVFLCGLSVTGCSMWSGVSKDTDDAVPQTALIQFQPAHHELIADNLISVIAQFEGHAPLTTTYQLSQAQTPFGRAVQKSIIDAGYGTQVVEGDLGVNLVRYLAENAETEQGFRTRYRIEIGDHYAERNYQVIDGFVVPDSEIRASGLFTDELKVNDSKFEESLFDSKLSYVSSPNVSEPEIRVIEFQRGALNLDESKIAKSSDTKSSDVVADSNADSSAVMLLEPVKGKNNKFVDDSNFTDVFRNYSDVLSGVLVFANDSLSLGRSNKAYIKQLANSFEPDSEIFSVIGCSHGITDIENGNEILANGRANRVKDALIVAGVEDKYIFDEGCWAPQLDGRDLPSRGVIISKKRLDK